MTNIAIVYHSGYGHTKRVAEFVAEGAKTVDGANVVIYTSEEAASNIDLLDSANAIIFGTPTYMGGPSAKFKEFIDATSKKWFKHQWKDKIAAGFTNSGDLYGDKMITMQQLITLALQHGMIWVGQSEFPAKNKPGSHGGQPEDINRVGSFSGLMTQSDNTAPEKTPSSGDIETAKLFGKRVAEVAKRWFG